MSNKQTIQVITVVLSHLRAIEAELKTLGSQHPYFKINALGRVYRKPPGPKKRSERRGRGERDGENVQSLFREIA